MEGKAARSRKASRYKIFVRLKTIRGGFVMSSSTEAIIDHHLEAFGNGDIDETNA